MLGAIVGRILCGNDPHCRVRYAADASIMFTMVMNYCLDHDCSWQPWLPPLP
jgi:hypothetical protein